MTWQNGGGENNYMTNAGAWDGSYAVGIKSEVKLLITDGATPFMSEIQTLQKQQRGRYSWVKRYKLEADAK